jgi:RimJ/RimL family protein N-acetyltransferase
MFNYDGVEFLKLAKGDLPELWKLKQESWLNTHRITFNTMDEQEAWFETLDSHPHSPSQLILVAHGPVANFGIFKILGVDYINRTAEVGWDVFEYNRGKGLGKKLVAAGSAFCFQILNLHRITAEILETNIASQKCAENAGYVCEGAKREAVHKQGVYVDSLIYGLLAADSKLALQSKTETV